MVAAAVRRPAEVVGDGRTDLAELIRTTSRRRERATGGTITDVTDRLHPAIADAAVRASRAIDIPLTGLDFMVPDVEGPDHVFIEANERPGLANHEPQPTVARFVDLLFPETRRR